ncbi:putative transposase-like protein [Salmonella phage SSBI34]|nr:putative transposase-like protein [Salmonella phage SSBI34]
MQKKTQPFDKEAFVFSTPIEKLEKCLNERYDELERLIGIKEPDPWAQDRIEDLKYWLSVWELQLPDAKRRGMVTVPTSAVENAILGLYEKPEEPYKPKKGVKRGKQVHRPVDKSPRVQKSASTTKKKKS